MAWIPLEPDERSVAKAQSPARWRTQGESSRPPARSRTAASLREQHSRGLLGQITRGRYSAVQMSDSYQLAIVDGCQLHPLRRFSGGEQDLAALCLRLVLSRSLARSRSTETEFVLLETRCSAARIPSAAGRCSRSCARSPTLSSVRCSSSRTHLSCLSTATCTSTSAAAATVRASHWAAALTAYKTHLHNGAAKLLDQLTGRPGSLANPSRGDKGPDDARAVR